MHLTARLETFVKIYYYGRLEHETNNQYTQLVHVAGQFKLDTITVEPLYYTVHYRRY